MNRRMNQNKQPRLQHTETKEVEFVKERLYEREKMFNQSSRMRKQNGKEAKIKDMFFPGLLPNMNLGTGNPTYTKAYT